MVSTSLLFAAFAALLPLVSSQLPRRSPVYGHDFEKRLPIPPVKKPLTSYTNQKTGTKIEFYEIKIKKFTAKLFPDLGYANLIGYDGMAPGPTFRIKKGVETMVRFVNEYDRTSAVHLHGSFTRAPFDGWAMDTIAPGEYKDYYYPNKQEARTIWYHDHAEGITAINAYAGQAGFYIIEDLDLENRLDLPRGDYEIPLMFQSHYFTATGDISDESAEIISTYGDTFSVNGAILPYLPVEPRKYRFRMLNAAASRTFNFTVAVEGKTELIPMWVVGSDAGFLSKPVKTFSLIQSMAERWDVVIDFSQFKGKKLILKSSNTFADVDYEGVGNMMQFRVGSLVWSNRGNGDLPSRLVSLDLPTNHAAIDQSFEFARIPPNGDWAINGRTFADPNSRILRNVPRGTTEKWEIRGSAGWSHPVHIHLVDFQILSRTALSPTIAGQPGRNYVTEYEAASIKDVAVVGTNEVVTVLAKYAPWDGVYMFHCHNLIHEDHDMMGALNITSLPSFGYPEKTRFLDPMDPRFRAKPYRGTNIRTIRDQVLPDFAKLEAYDNIGKLEQALDQYHTTRTPPPVGTPVPPAPSTPVGTPVPPATSMAPAR